ncbi:MAG TPA: hypothetical protein VNA17_00600 [Pyrinomonadaceae bacterium]|nr:hypothetical protein [Pyrinomonadaceae bacterium]
MKHGSPEEIELHKKQGLLDRLTDRLARRELEMADLRGDLRQFEARYTMGVGRLYADLDEIEAQIAEEEYKLVPDDEQIKKKAEELRRFAEESARRALEAADAASAKCLPTPEAKKAFHSLARAFHPDLALDSTEKQRRHVLMTRLNDAYSAGDQRALDKLAADFKHSPDQIVGDSIPDQLVRAIRKVAQVRGRLKALANERSATEHSELFTLREKMRAEAAEGRDMIEQMAARTNVAIKKSERRLNNLRAVNAAAERHVRDKYGMDISSFR